MIYQWSASAMTTNQGEKDFQVNFYSWQGNVGWGSPLNISGLFSKQIIDILFSHLEVESEPRGHLSRSCQRSCHEQNRAAFIGQFWAKILTRKL